jgi:hypothetical protein
MIRFLIYIYIYVYIRIYIRNIVQILDYFVKIILFTF